ncbi:MAG: hypothetical protein FWE32_06170 [Oscillospiraceae bacterium]|nr:hypothetical protein [Oscillospiraceae bacterium]
MHGVSQIDICEDVTVVTLTNMPLSLGVAVEAFSRIADAKIDIDMISQTSPAGDRVNLSFTCLDQDLRKVLEITKGIKKRYPKIESLVSSGNVKIQLFGEEMRGMPGVFARALHALSDAKVEPQLITTSEIDISLLIVVSSLPAAMESLTSAFNI